MGRVYTGWPGPEREERRRRRRRRRNNLGRGTHCTIMARL